MRLTPLNNTHLRHPSRSWSPLRALVAATILFWSGAVPAQGRADMAACADKSGDEAIAACTRVIDARNPRDQLDVAYYNRGVEWDEQGDYDRALVDYSEAIKLNPKYHEAYNNRAIIYGERRELARALADANQAVRLDPNDADYYGTRGSVYLKRNDYTRALADYNTALKLKPDDGFALDGAAWIMAAAPNAKLRDGKRAVALATKACELAQWKNASYLDTLAAAYAEAGDFKAAIRWQEQALADTKFAASEAGRNARHRLSLYKSGKPTRLSS